MPTVTSCRWCGEPLVPSNRPGRPRVAHPGECARRYRNRVDLARRVSAYYAAQQPNPDRSDDAPAFILRANGGKAADVLADGYGLMRPPPYRGKQLTLAVEAHEAAERARRRRSRGEPETEAEQAAELKRLIVSQHWDEPLLPIG